MLGVYRLDLDPDKMHWGVGVKVEPINTKQTEAGPPPWYVPQVMH